MEFMPSRTSLLHKIQQLEDELATFNQLVAPESYYRIYRSLGDTYLLLITYDKVRAAKLAAANYERALDYVQTVPDHITIMTQLMRVYRLLADWQNKYENLALALNAGLDALNSDGHKLSKQLTLMMEVGEVCLQYGYQYDVDVLLQGIDTVKDLITLVKGEKAQYEDLYTRANILLAGLYLAVWHTIEDITYVDYAHSIARRLLQAQSDPSPIKARVAHLLMDIQTQYYKHYAAIIHIELARNYCRVVLENLIDDGSRPANALRANFYQVLAAYSDVLREEDETIEAYLQARHYYGRNQNYFMMLLVTLDMWSITAPFPIIFLTFPLRLFMHTLVFLYNFIVVRA